MRPVFYIRPSAGQILKESCWFEGLSCSEIDMLYFSGVITDGFPLVATVEKTFVLMRRLLEACASFRKSVKHKIKL